MRMTQGADKITDEHRRRAALVYVRQSSAKQVQENDESRRRQYGLAELARAMGFASVEVVDDDLGRSGAGTVERPGFERLFRAVASGGVGAVFCLEISRLARNGRDWHTLLEVCRHLGTLIVSPDGVSDPRLGNDQLVLGVKGTLAEYELVLFRQRGQEARRSKARRGEHLMILPIGYCWNSEGVIEKTPDVRVQRALEQVYAKFRELGSAVQVTRWFVEEGVELPVLNRRKGHAREPLWRQPNYGVVIRTLKNPINAGAYAWGRSETISEFVDGRVRKRSTHPRPLGQWEVLIEDHHEGYICWDEYQRNLELLASNSYQKNPEARRRGRGGQALLSGLLRCRRCGTRVSAYYPSDKVAPRYSCMNGRPAYRAGSCMSFSSLDLDRCVAQALLEALQPMAIDAALAAARMSDEQHAAQRQLLVDEVTQREYEVNRASRRYEAVDPDNRLVASTLEAAWEHALVALADANARLIALDDARPATHLIDRDRFVALAEELEGVWNAASAQPGLKQRIASIMLEEIVIDVDEEHQEIVAKLHWCGGQHSDLRVPKRKHGDHRRRVAPEVVELLRAACPRWKEHDIATLLNAQGTTTGAGNPWTRGRVRSLRVKHGLPPYDPALAERYVSLSQATCITGASTTYLRRLMSRGDLPYIQICAGARFEILEADLSRPEITESLTRLREGRAPAAPAAQCCLPLEGRAEP